MYRNSNFIFVLPMKICKNNLKLGSFSKIEEIFSTLKTGLVSPDRWKLTYLFQCSNTWYKSLLNGKVAARTWIWKGINFGLLGCLKLTSCNGEIVTYTANIDLELSTQVLWINKTLSIFIKPVDTDINNVNVEVSI